MTGKRFFFGVAVSVGYLAGLAWIRWPFSLETLRQIPLNELGDFLAGAMGPIAILWLILGFLQQGDELRLQVEELKNSVEQQGKVAKAALDQLELETRRERERADAAREAGIPKFCVVHSRWEPAGAEEALINLYFDVLRCRALDVTIETVPWSDIAIPSVVDPSDRSREMGWIVPQDTHTALLMFRFRNERDEWFDQEIRLFPGNGEGGMRVEQPEPKAIPTP
jgi:hypothetical protein